MAENLYHILRFIPGVEAWELPPRLEALARELVASGKLRINADTERNFVRLGTRDTDQTLTARELTDPALQARTWAELARHVAPAEGPEGLTSLYQRLLADLTRARGVAPEKELKVARVLVQSADPSTLQWLLLSGTEVFVSYSHNLSDVVSIEQWDTHGKASGLQATADTGTAVYVSAGGDPFFEGEQKQYTTDGFPALARMVVIAGQELGHFADLRRTAQGIAGRHSTDPHHTRLRAAPAARDGRLADMRQVAELRARYRHAGLAALRRAEQAVAFYHLRLRYSPPWWFHQWRRGLVFLLFYLRCQRRGLFQPLHIYPYHRYGEALTLYLDDMECNLAPEAEVYRNPDPLVEEAIAVIEAVARVPQQVHKWGHSAVFRAWPRLYRFYYGTVLPANRALLTTPLAPQSMNIIQTLGAACRRALHPTPGFYPNWKPKKTKTRK